MANKKRNKKIIPKIIFVLIVCIIVGSAIFYRQYSKTVFNDSPNANGNTAGNLYNKGLFAESNGVVYFSNPLDNGYLYVMDSNETKAKRLSVEKVSSLNACGEYLYYSKNNMGNEDSTSIFRGHLLGAARCNLKGNRIKTFNNRYTGNVVLIGNTIYFQDYENDSKKGTTTFTIKSIGIDGNDLNTFTEEMIDIAGTTGSVIYYVDTKDHNIYAKNADSKSSSMLVEGNCWMPIVTGSELYYLDLSDRYSLIKTNISSPENKKVLVSEHVSTYNVSDTYIYFQIDDQENSKLCRIRKDASTDEYEVIAEGNYENINITSNYVYFNSFDNAGSTFRTPVNGPVHVQTLSEAVTFEKDE